MDLAWVRPKWTTYIAQTPERNAKQAAFLSPFVTEIQEVLYGGAAGGGKSSALLMAALQYVDVPGYAALLLRRTYKDLNLPGALMDRAMDWLAASDASWYAADMTWRFPSGASLTFGYLASEMDKYRYQGAEFQFIGFDETCHRPGTEVLTEAGWRTIETVGLGDRVLAMTPEWQARYEAVDKLYSVEYEGELVETANRSVRFSVTPNHRMVIEGQRDGRWRFCKADELPAYPGYPFDHAWDGAEVSAVRLPLPRGRGIGPNANAAEAVPADDYLRLLGWWMAEGSCFYQRERRASPVVSIRQTRVDTDLAEVVDALPWRVRADGDGGYRIYSRQLHDHLAALGDTYTKRVPRWVMGLSGRQLALFFEAFASGDGSRKLNGAVDFGLANEGLVDDLQEVAAKLGRRATKSYQRVRGSFDVWRLYVHARQGGRVCDKPTNARRVPYRGPVYCIRVQPSHTFLCRYQGRMFWSGNTQFTEGQYRYLFSRLRRLETASIPMRMRAASNPGGPGHEWVKQRFSIYRLDGDAEDAPLVCHRPEYDEPRMFIPAGLDDNPYLDREQYEGSLAQLDSVTEAQLRHGDWEAREPGEYFRREWFDVVDVVPLDCTWVRYWDLAATEPTQRNPDPDWTVGLRLGRAKNGDWYVADVRRGRWRSEGVEAQARLVAQQDGPNVPIFIEQEPGASGKAIIRHWQRDVLPGHALRGHPPSDSKAVRARPVASKCEAGMVKLVRGPWISSFLDELEAFTVVEKGGHDDQVDAFSGAFTVLEKKRAWTVV